MPKKHQPRVGNGKFGRVADLADVLVLSKDQMQGMADAIGSEIGGGNGWTVIEPMVAWIAYARDATGTVDKPTIDWVGHGQWLAATAQKAPSPAQAHQRASDAAQQMYGRKTKGKEDKKRKAALTPNKVQTEPGSPAALKASADKVKAARKKLSKAIKVAKREAKKAKQALAKEGNG